MISEWLNSQNEKTKRAYSWIINKYLTYSGIENPTYQNMDIGSMDKFIDWLLDNNYSVYTANLFISAMWSYSSYVVGKNVYDVKSHMFREQITRTLKFLPVPQGSTIEIVDDIMLRMLLDEISDDVLYSAVFVYFYTGARPTEIERRYKYGAFEDYVDISKWLYSSKPDPIYDPENGYLAIVTAKQTRVKRMPSRVLIIPKELRQYFDIYFENIDKIENYSSNGKAEWFTKKIKPVSNKVLGEKHRITAYSARKTFKTTMERLATDNLQAYLVKWWMGHKKKAPERYIQVTNLMEDINEFIVKNHYIWRCL